MSADFQELRENAERGAANDQMARVNVSMAILAVLVAVASLMGGRVHADAMLAQTQVTDQWAQYQAKVIRERSYEVFLDQLTVFTVQSGAQVDAVKKKYSDEINRYTGETNDIQKQANATEAEVTTLERRSNWLDFGEVLLESSLVICSITLLTQKKFYWYLGLAAGGSGTIIAAIGVFIH